MALLEKPITTQEEIDAIIGERLKRERETSAKKYEGWISPEDQKKLTDGHAAELKKLQDAAAAQEAAIKEKDALIAEGNRYKTDLEKTRIALNAGLKAEYADRLRGGNADEWKADAELLAKDFKAAHQAAPLGNPDPGPASQSTTQANGKKFAEWAEKQFNT